MDQLSRRRSFGRPAARRSQPGRPKLGGYGVARVEYILEEEFRNRGFDATYAPLYAQMLVGMVGTAGQWWLEARSPSKDEVGAHLVNLAWYGLSGIHKDPELRTRP